MPRRTEQPLLTIKTIRCPFCMTEAPASSYTLLLMPEHTLTACVQIYKHGGESGCKRLFALRYDS